MSASREKKSRQDETSQGPASREQKKQQEAAEARRSAILYRIVGVVCVVLVAFLLVWNTGLIQRGATAVTINGVKYTAADVQYYYTNLASQYGMGTGSASLKDLLLPSALEYMETDLALADKAEAEGYTMSEEARAYLDSQIETLDAMANQKDFIRSNYGPYMTYEKLLSLMERQTLSSDYQSSYLSSLEYSSADIQNYYQENKDALDTYTLTQFVLQAKADTSDTEMTEEEKTAALEEAKEQKKALAEEIQRKLEAGEDPTALVQEYDSELYSSQISDPELGSKVNSAYTEWAFDSARREGDVTLAEYDSDTAYNYYVVRFEGRELDTVTPIADVRHILVKPETSEGASEPSAEQMAAAKAEAEALLAQWKAGEATEDSFADLARENSADSGSASDGGLISGVTADSSYVESFKNWAVDPARQVGDTGLVESSYGWHIMYYVSGAPVWESTATSALRSQDYQAWVAETKEGYTSVSGMGLKFIQG